MNENKIINALSTYGVLLVPVGVLIIGVTACFMLVLNLSFDITIHMFVVGYGVLIIGLILGFIGEVK